jgi:hypothetical protein
LELRVPSDADHGKHRSRIFWKHQIEDNQIIRLARCLVESRFTVVANLDVISLFFQPVAEVGETVAVKVTDALYIEGFEDDVSAVVVLALFTVCVSVDEVLPL